MTGSPARAVGPRSALSDSVGTGRQPTRRLALLGDDPLDLGLALLALGLELRQEDVAHRESPRLGQLDAQVGLDDLLQELVRQGGQDARAVARVGLAAAGAAVVHAAQQVLRVDHDLMAPLSLDVRDEADAARVVLVRGVVESASLGEGAEGGASVHGSQWEGWLWEWIVGRAGRS